MHHRCQDEGGKEVARLDLLYAQQAQGEEDEQDASRRRHRRDALIAEDGADPAAQEGEEALVDQDCKGRGGHAPAIARREDDGHEAVHYALDEDELPVAGGSRLYRAHDAHAARAEEEGCVEEAFAEVAVGTLAADLLAKGEDPVLDPQRIADEASDEEGEEDGYGRAHREGHLDAEDQRDGTTGCHDDGAEGRRDALLEQQTECGAQEDGDCIDYRGCHGTILTMCQPPFKEKTPSAIRK